MMNELIFKVLMNDYKKYRYRMNFVIITTLVIAIICFIIVNIVIIDNKFTIMIVNCISLICITVSLIMMNRCPKKYMRIENRSDGVKKLYDLYMESEIVKYSKRNSVLEISLMVIICSIAIFLDLYNVFDFISITISVILSIAFIVSYILTLTLVAPSEKKATEFLIKNEELYLQICIEEGISTYKYDELKWKMQK